MEYPAVSKDDSGAGPMSARLVPEIVSTVTTQGHRQGHSTSVKSQVLPLGDKIDTSSQILLFLG